jgi:hypothetical protein
MKLSNVCKIIRDSDRLRNILLQNQQALTNSEILEVQDLLLEHKSEDKAYVCDLLRDYRNDDHSLCDLLDISKGEKWSIKN